MVVALCSGCGTTTGQCVQYGPALKTKTIPGVGTITYTEEVCVKREVIPTVKPWEIDV